MIELAYFVGGFITCAVIGYVFWFVINFKVWP